MQHLRIAVLTLFVLAFPATATQPAKKAPIPSETEQKQARKLIDELFAQELEKARPKDAIANANLGQLFLVEARATNDYPAGQYVLLDLAVARALQGGDSNTALQAIDEMAQHFVLPPRGTLQKKIAALLDVGGSSASPEAHLNMIDSAYQLVYEAVAEDDYPSALQLIAAAESAARKLRNVPMVTRVRKDMEELRELEKKFARWKPFADKLATAPEDAEANLAMGAYHALLKANWEKGLPLLARASGNPRFENAAVLDLADPSMTKKKINLAELWFDLSQKNPLPKLIDDKEFADNAKIQLLLRSYHWYQDALGYLNGKERDKIEQRLQKITALLPPEYAVGELTTELGRWDSKSGPIYCAAFSPDSKKIVAAGVDGVIRLLDVRSGKQLKQIEGLSGRIWTVCFSADSRHVITGGFDGSIRLWNLAAGREVRRFTGHTDYVRSVTASREGKLILSGGDDRMVRLWNEETGQEIRFFKGHEHFVWSVALSRNASQALSASLDRTVRLWDVASGKQLQELRGHKDSVLSVVFTPDGRRALSGSTDKTLILWDLEAGTHVVFPKTHTGYINSVAVSPDGRRAISGSQDKTVRLWDLHTGKELRVLEGHLGQVWHVAFSPDGRLALSCSEDGTLRIWSGSKYR